MIYTANWEDFELIDAGDGEKLERWGRYVLCRPDPQAIWPKRDPRAWEAAHARYIRSSEGGGAWDYATKLPERWNIGRNGLSFIIAPMGFKHTGLFPEQAANWDWMEGLVKNAGREINVLNMFAYTGGATVALARAGATVCHVDAAKGMVQRAKENLELSGLGSKPVRFIVDDCRRFVERELRRGRKYDAILMDPPSFGRGPSGEVWKLEDALFPLVKLCAELLSDNPLFFLINSYTTGLQPLVLQNILSLALPDGCAGAGEVGLKSGDGGLILPCGASGRWTSDKGNEPS